MNLENSQDYYGKVLAGSSDLKTDACCTMEAPPPEILSALRNVHEEVKARYYGCGLVAPQAIAGCHVLDLGSGSGQDAYILAQLVGSEGSVTGVDATPEQLAVARGHEDWHRQRFGYDKSNVRFLEGDIEKLGDLDLPEGHFDVIVSNCVINLVADKRAVFEAAHRLLKPGGELYFSDVYSERQCEDYGQAVRYRGTVPGQERVFELDGHHHIEAGRMFPICGNSWKMLADTRFAEHFDFFGDFMTHYGVFPDCGVAVPFGATGPTSDASAPAACC